MSKELAELGKKMLRNKHYAIIRIKSKKKSEEKFNELKQAAERANYNAKEDTVVLDTYYISIHRLVYDDDSVFYLISFSTTKEDILIDVHDDERKLELFLFNEKMKQKNDEQLIDALLQHLKTNYKKIFDHSL